MKNKIFFVGSILLIIALAWAYLSNPQVKVAIEKYYPISSRIDDSKIKRQVAQIADKYHNDCQAMLDEFLENLDDSVAPDFEQAHSGVPHALDNLCGFSTCVKLSYKAAKDKMTGSNDFESAYMELMYEPIIQPCLHASQIAANSLHNLEQRLKERHNEYCMELAALGSTDNSAIKLSEAERSELETQLFKFAGSIQTFHLKKNLGVIGGVYEIVDIWNSYRYILKLFAKPVAKICGSLGGAGICAAADGPLPIGDVVGGVITLGGLTWTAYDIYDVTCIMPKKLNAELHHGVTATQNKLLAESRSIAQNMVRFFQENGRKLSQKLSKNL